jgi:peptidyl-prolyl cis-trans isomerase SurA
MTRLFTELRRRVFSAVALLTALMLGLAASSSYAQAPASARSGDFIVAVVNQELVTNSEVQQRIRGIEQDASRSGQRLPPRDELQRRVLDALIDDRAQLSHARDVGIRIDESEIDRAVANVASQNQITLPQLRERLRKEGVDFARFRSNVRDQLLLQRVREREVHGRIRVSEADIDQYLAEMRGKATSATEYNIAQILVAVPEGASEAQVAERRARAEEARAKAAQSASAFDAAVKEFSEGPNRDQGGQIGLRPAARLPDLFVETVRNLKAGEVAPSLVRSGAGFHVLKLVERRERAGFTITQSRVRHILLRISPQLSQETALARLAEYRRRIEAGTVSFPQLAREVSEDGSAPQGGDLGWANPGQFVPEFEKEMAQLAPGKLSEPFMSRFGAHLLQVTDRREARLDERQQRELATNALKERKFDSAYEEWAREIRQRAYVEMREAPQ